MNKSEILISWIIIGKNWGTESNQLIESLNTQNFNPKLVELIIIDDCSNDESIKSLNNIKFGNKKIIELQTPSGRCAARNHGINLATGKFCLFTNSNTLPTTDFLDIYIKILSKADPDVAAGEYDYLCLENSFGKYLNNSKRGLKSIRLNQAPPIEYMLFGNCAVKTELLNSVNGFNEKLTGYGGEEFELLNRITKIKKLKLMKVAANVIRMNHPDIQNHILRLIEFGSTNFKELPLDIQYKIIPRKILQWSNFIPVCIIYPFLLRIVSFIPNTQLIRILMGFSILRGYKS